MTMYDNSNLIKWNSYSKDYYTFKSIIKRAAPKAAINCCKSTCNALWDLFVPCGQSVIVLDACEGLRSCRAGGGASEAVVLLAAAVVLSFHKVSRVIEDVSELCLSAEVSEHHSHVLIEYVVLVMLICCNPVQVIQ
jgi:hypothetical protein